MADVLQFPAPPGSPELIRTLEQMLADARRHRLIALAYVAEYQHNEFIVDIVGETHAPAAMRRMLPFLDDKLGELAQGSNPLKK